MRKKEIIAQLITRVEALENALLRNVTGRDVCIEPTQEEPTQEPSFEMTGKWWWVEHSDKEKYPKLALAYCNTTEGNSKGNYGFSHIWDWIDGEERGYGFYAAIQYPKKLVREALKEEMYIELTKEAKRRGLIEGVRIKSPWIEAGESEYRLGSDYKWDGQRLLSNGPEVYTIMRDGIWAEPIHEEPEQDKFAELKEAHRNGAVIQCRIPSNIFWLDDEPPSWSDDFEYRIKPEEKPKVGDYVKAWYKSEDQFAVGVVKEIIDRGNFKFDIRLICYPDTSTSILYPNAKSLTKQEAISLLFGEVEKLVLPEIKKDGFLSDEECSYKIDIFKSSKEEGRVTIYKNKNYLTGKELINLLFGNEKTN